MQMINLLLLGLVQSVQGIIGGTDATLSTAPFIVSLNSNSWNGKSHICGGILRDSNTVITAAVCCDGLTDVFVLYGGLDRAKLPNERKVTKILIHPKWNARTMDYNICLLKLSAPASEGNGVRFATLANRPLTDGDEVTVLGWGRTASLSPDLPRGLQQTNAKFLLRAECEAAWKDSATPITNNMMCDAGVDGASTCAGDAGGPIILKATGEVVGMTAFGAEGCTSFPKPNVNVDFTDTEIRPYLLQNV